MEEGQAVIVVGAVNSLERRKAKKARVKADHSMSLSCGDMVVSETSWFLRLRRTDIVMGN